jgi:hypothetical protein
MGQRANGRARTICARIATHVADRVGIQYLSHPKNAYFSLEML